MIALIGTPNDLSNINRYFFLFMKHVADSMMLGTRVLLLFFLHFSGVVFIHMVYDDFPGYPYRAMGKGRHASEVVQIAYVHNPLPGT